MGKIDVLKLRKPKNDVFRYVFTDVANPGVELEFHWRQIDGIEDEGALVIADELGRRYITGGFEDPVTEKWSKEPWPFEDSDGNRVTLNERIITLAARMQVMQSPPDPEDVYGAEEILRIVGTMPTAWEDMKAIASRIRGGQDPKALWEAYMKTASDSHCKQE